ncbi:MAG TPA: flagellar filament capping protein FliD [Ruminiclostridium sp.]|nr:flagellar filament capping protein FliD [Ruminiclostridium sp.]
MATISATSGSSSSSSTSTVQNGHYWGLASGLDVDSIVTAMVSKEQSKIDKAQQSQQKLEWKQEAYRDIISKLSSFENAYLQLGQSTSMGASSMYTSFSCTSSSPYLTVSANSDADGAAQNVVIKQSATIAALTGSSIKGIVQNSKDLDNVLSNLKQYASMAESVGDADPAMTVTVDGVSKNLSFSSSDLSTISTASDLVGLVNTKLTSAFGTVPNTSGTGTTTKVVASLGAGDTLVLSTAGGYQTQFSLTGVNGDFDARMLSTVTQLAADNGTAAPTMNVSYGGVSKTLTFSTSDDLSQSGYLATINSKLAAAFPDKGLTASVDSKGAITIKDTSGTAASVTTANTSFNALDAFAMSDGTNNRLNINNTTLGDYLTSKGVTPAASNVDANGNIWVTINGQKVTLGTSGTKLSDVFANIDKSGAGVTISYDKTLDTISLTANQSGAAGSVDISKDTSGIFSAFGFTNNYDIGKDALVTINGVDYTRDSNNFVINGVTYGITSKVDLNDASTTIKSTVTFAQNTSTLKKGIQDFVSAYNTLIAAVHTQINTSPDKDYQPLTDAQKNQMSETQIDKWNDKAKAGMLFDDGTLETITDQMRDLLYQPVTASDGSTISLYDIGITTSDFADDYGKLEIKTEDESKFEDAIARNADKIKDLFTKTSDILLDIAPTTDSGVQAQKTRRQEEGLVGRLDDVIKGAIGSVSGSKGSLLVIAGNVGDSTQYDNSIYDQLKDISSTISDLQDRLKTEKERYYSQFEKLETFMAQANSQSSSLTSMLGK